MPHSTPENLVLLVFSQTTIPLHHMLVLMDTGAFHLQEAFETLGYKDGDFPITENISKRILSLPMHPYLTEEDTNNICDIVMEKKTHEI